MAVTRSLINFLSHLAHEQGLRHADENGGDGDQAAAKPGFSSEGNPYQKPKTQRIWLTIFLKMGGDYPPHSQKWGGRVPPSPPPCGGAPAHEIVEHIQQLGKTPL